MLPGFLLMDHGACNYNCGTECGRPEANINCEATIYLLYRVTAFDVTCHKTSATLSVILRFAHKTARQKVVSSMVILETQAA